MPGFNELGRGKLALGIAKLLGVTDDAAIRTLSPEVSSVVQLPVSVEELMGAAGWGRWSSGTTIATVGGAAGRCKIRNPVGSGALVIVEDGQFSSDVNNLFSADGGYLDTGDLSGGSINVDFRDGRLNPRGSAVAIVSIETNASPFAGVAGRVHGLARTAVQLPVWPVILLPGNSYVVGCTTSGEFCFTLTWRERGATPAELKF